MALRDVLFKDLSLFNLIHGKVFKKPLYTSSIILLEWNLSSIIMFDLVIINFNYEISSFHLSVASETLQILPHQCPHITLKASYKMYRAFSVHPKGFEPPAFRTGI